MLGLSLQDILIAVAVVTIGLTVHEYAHAITAYWFGDVSQVSNGRLSFNPIRHMDPLGFIMLVIVGFGWAKPVIIQTDKLRSRNIAPVLIALAGPVSNLILAFVGLIVLKLGFDGIASSDLAFDIATRFIAINLALFVFNLLPIPPLDGSHLVTEAFFKHKPLLVMRFNQIGAITLFAVFILQAISSVEILPIGKWVMSIFRVGLDLFDIPVGFQ